MTELWVEGRLMSLAAEEMTARRPNTKPSTTISTTPWSPRLERNELSLQDHRGGSFFPPKWGINTALQAVPADASTGQGDQLPYRQAAMF